MVNYTYCELRGEEYGAWTTTQHPRSAREQFAAHITEEEALEYTESIKPEGVDLRPDEMTSIGPELPRLFFFGRFAQPRLAITG